ncbi:hypothetical protein [Streptomyces sp. NPDC017524]|uniref:hypothetical protein n=1 Tax=Streptomyces sp. NPDC017524 TaxID=3364999 RepID=UPI0037A174C9
MRRGAVNRSLLGAAGLVLAVCGGWLFVGDGSEWVPVVGRVPHWWLTPAPGGVLLDRESTGRLREES